MKDGNFMKLVEQFTGGTLVLGSSKGCRTFAAAMVTIMSHLNLDQHQAFIDKVSRSWYVFYILSLQEWDIVIPNT